MCTATTRSSRTRRRRWARTTRELEQTARANRAPGTSDAQLAREIAFERRGICAAWPKDVACT
ncbi:hypothetical protein [Streptomyces finlayi]|uniref:hypothetical protein n=1 Tax=Streptomyces finlayi TaxID=67296 RepID=UPI001675A735|nr:hypothetical protein [Streptomyces finlayi]